MSSTEPKLLRAPDPAVRRAPSLWEEESGSSLIEFIMLGTVLLIPLVYLLLAVSSVQAAAYAGTGAADQAAKVYVSSSGEREERRLHSEAAVEAALADFGIEPSQADVTLDCPAGSCEADGDVVVFTVEIGVPVPLVPQLGSWEPQMVSVTSSSAQVQGG